MKQKGATQGTNHQLAIEHNTTARQISKSRKRGWITTKDGIRKQYKAPMPVFTP